MLTSYLRSMRRIPRDVWLTMVTETVGFGAAFGVVGVLLNLYLLRIGYGPEFIGLINGAGWIGMLIGASLAGLLNRLWGARCVMIIGFSGVTVGYSLLGLADLAPAPLRDVGLPVVNALAMASVTLYLVNVSVYIMAVTEDASRDHAFALRSAVGPLGAAALSLVSGVLPGVIAPWLGVTLSDPAPYRWVLVAGGLLQAVGVVALALTHRAPKQGPTQSSGNASPLPWAPLAVMALISLLRWAALGPANTFFNVYLDDRLAVPTAVIGLVRATGQVLAIPAALTMPILAGRWGRPRLLWVSMGIAGLCAVPLALVPQAGAASLFFLAMATSMAVGNPALSRYAQEIVAPEWRAAMVGTTMMATGLGGGLMSYAGGVAIATLGYRELFLSSALVAWLGAGLIWAYARRRRRAQL